MKHNKNFINDIEKLQKIEQKLYDQLKSIGDHKPKEIKCANGFSGPNKKGECVAYWNSKCGLQCHKKKCAASGGKWIPKNYMRNPYTCKPQTENDYGPKDKDYRGNVNKTKTGLTCQRWDSQSPHKHKFSSTKNKNDGLENNYCRNPDNAETVWCYTTDPKKRWEYCNIPEGDEELAKNEEKKKEIMKKINEISQIRINLYQQLKDKFNDKRVGLIRNYGNLKDKATILYNTEKKMNLIKKEINSKKHLLESKIRVVEINEKLLDEEIINKQVLKITFFICFLIILAILIGKIPVIPQALTYLLITTVLIVGTIRILKLKYYQYAEDGLYRKDYYYIGTNEPTSVVLNNNENSYESPDVSNVLGGLKDDYSAITDGRFTDNTVVEFDAYENFQPNDLKYTGSVSSV
jgi:hypothetical protein